MESPEIQPSKEGNPEDTQLPRWWDKMHLEPVDEEIVDAGVDVIRGRMGREEQAKELRRRARESAPELEAKQRAALDQLRSLVEEVENSGVYSEQPSGLVTEDGEAHK